MRSGSTIIKRVELCAHRASARSTWTVLLVESADGTTGIGECSDSGNLRVLETAVRAARTALVGKPAEAARTGLARWLRDQRDEADPATAFAWSTALGGIEAALEDLTARTAGATLAETLGADTPERVQLYANLNRTWGDRGLAKLTSAARAAALEGFPAVKIAPFDGSRHADALGQVVAEGLAVVDAVQAVLPPGTALMIDCHFRLDDDALLIALPELAARQVFWIEDAVDPRNVDQLRRMRDRLSVPLAAGEHEWSPAVVEAACSTGALDFWLIDPKHAGGPRATRRLLELTGDAQVSYHNPSGPVGTVHAAHLATLSSQLTWLEYAWGEPDRADFLSPAEKVENGELVLPEGPGVAVALAAECADPGIEQ